MRKKLTGIVLRDGSDKTRVVEVHRTFRHPKYDKVVRVARKIHCHDEKNISVKGDRVVLMESRPFSKLKRWVILGVEKGQPQIKKGSTPG